MSYKIDKYSRIQKNLQIADMFPYRKDGLCRYGCNKKVLPPRLVWCSNECSSQALDEFFIIKGYSMHIRKLIFERDKGICNVCKTDIGYKQGYKKTRQKWQADHIIPVQFGGGGCGLDNYQLLCIQCHKIKSRSVKRSMKKC